ncbi:MAG: hypothetical protein WBM24_17425 [Candidatus Sulfotelmatobacter sp.]
MIEVKLRRWCSIARYPQHYSACSSAQARKNFWRLCARYPLIMKKAGLTELSVYP